MNTTSPAPDSTHDITHRSSSATIPVLVESQELMKDLDQSTPQASGSSYWKVFGTTFITIFLAEMGDKTQVATLLMTAESHSPWLVFAGAAAALISTSLVGVLLGRWLSQRLSSKTLDTAAGLTLTAISMGLLWDVMQH